MTQWVPVYRARRLARKRRTGADVADSARLVSVGEDSTGTLVSGGAGLEVAVEFASSAPC